MLKCQHCGTTTNGAGETFKTKGALKAHERFCNENKNRNNVQTNVENENVSRETLTDTCECGSKYRDALVVLEELKGTTLYQKLKYHIKNNNVEEVCMECGNMRGSKE